jgi:PAS domain S-box-containing protein
MNDDSKHRTEHKKQGDALEREIADHARTKSALSDSEAELVRVERVQELLRESEARFRGFAEASSDVLWVRDAQTLRWEYVSPAIEAVYGISREEAWRQNDLVQWVHLIVPEDRDHALDCIARAVNGERVSFEYRIKSRQDGKIRWLRSNVFPMRNQDGRVERIGGIGRDMTALKLASDRQEILLAELQHRVRNTLAVIRSIVRRTAETSQTVEDFANHLEGRIGAFSRVQVAVTRDPLAGFNLGELISEELRVCVAREGEQYTLQGPPARLPAKTAESIGLAIHELATNAIEHGALTVPRGHIDVRWRKAQRESETWLVLDWKESGMNGRLVEQRREGFGSVLLRHTLRYDLGAEVTLAYEPSGLRCEIAFPLAVDPAALSR